LILELAIMASGNDKAEYLVGVDLGGSKIYAGVFDPRLTLQGTAKLSTKAERGAASVIERISRCVRDAVDECDLSPKNIKAVGVGSPGTVDGDTGRVLFASSLDWENVALQKELQKNLETPVYVGNDSNVAMLGVYTHELKAKPTHVIGIFIGTGIGGGIILNGEPYTGGNHAAGEVGHMVVDMGGPKCRCGNTGCLEAVASRTAIFRRIQAAIKDGQKTILSDMLGSDLKGLRSSDLRKAVRRGDKFVEKVVGDAAECIGVAVGNLINLFSPEVIVLGGGLIEALDDEMMPTITKTAREHVLTGTQKDFQIVSSKLGDTAGMIGAAVFARQASRESARL
jgi:glucokinase